MFLPLSTQVAEQHADSVLTASEEMAETLTYAVVSNNGDGTYTGRFLIPEAHGRLLSSYLQRLSAPRRLGRDKNRQPVTDATVPGWTTEYSHGLGLALCQLVEHLPTEGWDGKNALTLLVTMPCPTSAARDGCTVWRSATRCA